jgi:RHS repeat-associated protein
MYSKTPENNSVSESFAEVLRFGFNGKLKDDEIAGVTGADLDFGARIYDSRVGRWLSSDPLAMRYPWQSPYAGLNNNPINVIDPSGMGGEVIVNADGTATIRVTVNIYKDDKSIITNEELETYATNLSTDVETVLNKPDPSGISKTVVDANGVTRIISNFDVNVLTLTSAEAVIIANSNTNPAVNFFLVTKVDPSVSIRGGTARGGNSGVLFYNNDAEGEAHEIATTLTYNWTGDPNTTDPSHSEDPNSVLQPNAPKGTTITANDCKKMKVNKNNRTFSGMLNNIYSDESIKDWLSDQTKNPNPINSNDQNQGGKKKNIYEK